MAMHDPPHPGGIVRRQCLEPLGLKVTRAAERLGVTRQALSELLNGRTGVSVKMTIRLSKAFGSTPETWLGNSPPDSRDMSARTPPSAHLAHPDHVPPCSVIPREARARVDQLLSRAPAVVLTGPRQVGETTLALEFARERNAAYLDLEDQRDRAKLADIHKYCDHNSHRLVILDEIHRVPGLFEPLRGIIDQRRREGRRAGLFLLLGSASSDLLRQTGETLARSSSVLRDATPERSGSSRPGRGRSLASRRNARQPAGDERRRQLRMEVRLHSHLPGTQHPSPRPKDSGGNAPSLLDHAGPRSGTTVQRRPPGPVAGTQRSHRRTLPRPDGRPPPRAAPGVMAKKRGQAPGQGPQKLSARQRDLPRVAGNRVVRCTAWTPGCGRQLGRVRDREHSERRPSPRVVRLLPHGGGRGDRSGAGAGGGGGVGDQGREELGSEGIAWVSYCLRGCDAEPQAGGPWWGREATRCGVGWRG